MCVVHSYKLHHKDLL